MLRYHPRHRLASFTSLGVNRSSKKPATMYPTGIQITNITAKITISIKNFISAKVEVFYRIHHIYIRRQPFDTIQFIHSQPSCIFVLKER